MNDREIKSLVRIGVLAFFIAGVGVGMGFIGAAIDEMVFARTGFVITVLGVCVGFVIVFVGIIKNAKSAVVGGLSSLPELKSKLRKTFGRKE